MRKTFFSLLLFTASLHAATNINVGSTVVTSGARRFGISGISHYYYDRLLLKNLVWRNAGFEGLQWRTVIRCDHGTATTCVDDLLSDQWPNGFWDGGTFEFILGTAKGRTGTIASFLTAPRDNVTGNTFNFADSGTAPAQGDYFIARNPRAGGIPRKRMAARRSRRSWPTFRRVRTGCRASASPRQAEPRWRPSGHHSVLSRIRTSSS